MMKAIKMGKIPFQAHLDTCETCRREFTLLSRFSVAGREPISRPNHDSIDRFTAIPLIYDEGKSRRKVAGSLSFDSWSHRPAAQLRDTGTGLTRRLCLDADGVTLEIMAERQQDQWEFVARVYHKNVVSSEYVLRIGKQKLLPRSHGFFHWSSRRAPGRIRLLSESLEVCFEGLSWA